MLLLSSLCPVRFYTPIITFVTIVLGMSGSNSHRAIVSIILISPQYVYPFYSGTLRTTIFSG